MREYGLRFDPAPSDITGQTDARESRPVLARSDSLNHLASEMKRYAIGDVLGRSCLIAGPRGSGKSTLVERAHDETSDAEGTTRCRLIRVRLHGPSLLANPAVPYDKKKELYEHVLKTMLLNLYQTLAEEMANAYQQIAEPIGSESAEMAAQLRIVLDGAPTAAVLRIFWDRIGALPHGVLTFGGPNQGLAEIVALATAAEAYRSASGQYKREQKDEGSAGSKLDQKQEFAAKGSDFKQLITSAASFLGVAATAQAAAASQPVAIAAGAVAALASLYAVSFTSSRSLETVVKEAVTFLPDLSVSALVHRVPLVLQRLRQAHIAPIFMIDELDKVPACRLTELASYLKFITADQAFFCFLTDRGYLAAMAAVTADQVERTIFTNLFSVVYHIHDLRLYLNTVITTGGTPSHDVEAEDMAYDAEALRFTLLQRARMLPFELRRAIAEVNDGTWLVVAPREPRTSKPYVFHLMLQLAIEYVLTTPSVAERLQRDAAFAQLVYDAVYYPTNRWYSGELELDLSAVAIFKGLAEVSGHEITIPPQDKELIHQLVRRVITLVENPHELATSVGQAARDGQMSVSTPVRESIPEMTALVEARGGDKYEWRVNRFGTWHKAGDVDAILANEQLRAAEDTIVEMRQLLATLALRPTVETVTKAVEGGLALLERVGGLTLEI